MTKAKPPEETHLWRPEIHDRELIRRWRLREKLSVIAEEMGFGTSTVNRQRKRLGLLTRLQNRRTELKVNLNENEKQAVNRRARQMGTTSSDYLRRLIERDLGISMDPDRLGAANGDSKSSDQEIS